MERKYRRSVAARGGLLALILAAGAGVATPACAQLRGARVSNVDCYRADFGGKQIGESDADRCRRLAGDASQPRQWTIYANFHAGRAYRMARNFAKAEEALRDVVGFNGDRAGPRATQPDLRFELTRIEAELELARVYREQAGRKAEAAEHTAKAIAGYSGYHSNPGFTFFKDDALAGRIDATELMVDVQRNMPPPNRLLAFEALHGLFLDPSLDRNPRAQKGRRDLRDTAIELGTLQLAERSEEGLGNARAYFTVALRAANMIGDQGDGLNIADVYVKLGEVHMAAGGLTGPAVAGGCEADRVNVEQVQEALRQFTLAASSGTSRDALLWKGCAQMGLNQLEDALGSFSAALSPDNPSPHLSLGRAYYKAARAGAGMQAWDRSRGAYGTALQIMERRRDGAADRALVHAELAEVDLALVSRMPSASPQRTAAIREARANLTRAASSLRDLAQLGVPQSLAYLRLAEMQIGDEPYKDAPADFAGARDNISRVLRGASGPGRRPVLAHAYYLQSKLEVRRGVDVAAAIRNADEAAEIGGELTGVYHAQACEVRLRFKRLANGERYCKADDIRNRDDIADALLREGIYYLSVGTAARSRGGQNAAWDGAYKAFDRGAAGLPDFTSSDPRANHPLKARLLAGKALAMICSGLGSVGGDIIRNDIPAPLSNDARSYFDVYRIACVA